MSNDAHAYHGTGPVVVDDLMQSFLTENVLQDAHELVTGASQRRAEDKLELETRFSETTGQCRHISIAMEKVNYYGSGPKPSTREVILKDLRRIFPNPCFNLNNIRRIATAKGRSNSALMEHTQPR